MLPQLRSTSCAAAADAQRGWGRIIGLGSRWRLAVAALWALGGTAASGAGVEPVDTALVLAVDVSLSVDDGRYRLQKEGIAAAFETRAVIDAIASGRYHAVEVALKEFSDPDRQILVVPWTRVASAAEAAALARRIRAVRRSSQGLTGVADALLAARDLLAEAPYPADRRLVDISSDGMSNIGIPITQARDALLADGITINGLPILSEEPWLETYYTEYVIGGPDAFVEVARDRSTSPPRCAASSPASC